MSATADESRARAAAAGIRTLAIPTPFLVGRVNVYLIEDEPLTLVDSGPNSGKALDELERGLADLGHRIEDLELLVVTHQHMDHLGLTDILARRSGAEVAALDRLAPYAARFVEESERDDEFAVAIMLRHGIAPDVVSALRAVSSAFRGWGAAVTVTRPLADGATLSLRDRDLRVLHRPGHSPSDTLLLDERRGLMLGGDHLIGHVSSNPLISRPLPAPGETSSPLNAARPHALVSYLESLRATRELPLELVLAGHGDPVTDHVALIDDRMAMHDRRARKIHGLLGDGPLTAHQLAQAMWGNISVTQAYLTLSEVLGHLDLLVADGRVVEQDDGGEVVRFAAATPPA